MVDQHPFQPSAVARIELTDTLPTLSGERDQGAAYRGASVLVTVHGRPIGFVTAAIPSDGLGPDALASAIQAELGNEIEHHLSADGIDTQPLTRHGLTGARAGRDEEAPCWAGTPSRADVPLVSVIVATKDRTDELAICLQKLLELDYPDFEVIVVDNGATTAKTKDLVTGSYGDDDRVQYVELKKAGTSLARNAGVQAARGPIVAFTDDDVEIDRNWLKALVRQFALHDDVDCVTGLVVAASYDHQPQQWFEEYGGFDKGYEAKIYDRTKPVGASALYPYTAGTFGSGNNAAYRREALLALGGFDIALGPGTPTQSGEDLDTFLAVIMNGRKIAYEPAAIIGHYHRADYDGLRKQLANYGKGLSSLIVKWAMKDKRFLFDIASRVPLGVRTVLDPKSPKNENRSTSFPPELGRAELVGMAKGPFLYALSRRKFGHS